MPGAGGDLTRSSRLVSIISKLKSNITTEATKILLVTEVPSAIKLFDAHELTENICLAAVGADGRVLELIPNTFKNLAVCLAAVTNNGLSLQYIDLTTFSNTDRNSIQEAAVTENYFALEYCNSVTDSLVALAFT